MVPAGTARVPRYNEGMRSRSFPLGTIFGVELRLHLYAIVAFFLLLFHAAMLQFPMRRAVGLWLLLMSAVAVREIGRALASAYAGRDLRLLQLTPSGGLAFYADEDDDTSANGRLVALAGPIFNFSAAIAMALLVFAVTSHVNLFQRPVLWPNHLLRAAIWLQVFMGGLHLLPASPLDAGKLFRKHLIRARGLATGSRTASRMGQAFGWALVVTGAFSQEILLILIGGSVLLTSQSEGHVVLAQQLTSTLTMRDVMLSEWTSVSASDTLQDAVRRSNHSLQEIFPVVRGPIVVGAVSRETLLLTLRSDGNSYVQGVMSRSVFPAAPGDPLIETLTRAGAGSRGAVVILPVVQGDRMVGLVTPQHLSRTMLSLGRSQRVLDGPPREDAQSRNDD